jgi:hypothetical protein
VEGVYKETGDTLGVRSIHLDTIISVYLCIQTREGAVEPAGEEHGAARSKGSDGDEERYTPRDDW